MAWHTLDCKPVIGEHFRKLRDEITARNSEAKANPPAPKFDHSTAPEISPRLRPYLDKIVADMAEAQAEEEKLWGK